MKLVRVINRTSGEVLAERAELADNIWTRFMGLMGRASMADGDGLWLPGANGMSSRTPVTKPRRMLYGTSSTERPTAVTVDMTPTRSS